MASNARIKWPTHGSRLHVASTKHDKNRNLLQRNKNSKKYLWSVQLNGKFVALWLIAWNLHSKCVRVFFAISVQVVIFHKVV